MSFTALLQIRLFIVAVLIGLMYGVTKLIKSVEHRRYMNRFKELKQICKFLVMYRMDPIEAEKYRTKNIVLEREWLYTKNFFFNLKENEEFKKVEAYYIEILKYFATSKIRCDKETCKNVLNFKSVLDMLV